MQESINAMLCFLWYSLCSRVESTFHTSDFEILKDNDSTKECGSCIGFFNRSVAEIIKKRVRIKMDQSTISVKY